MVYLCQHYIDLSKKNDPKARAISKQIIWAISNLCRSKPAPELKFTKPSINILCDSLISETD